MPEYKLTKKEKFSYWWKIIFLTIFGLIAAFAAVYTIVSYPFNILTLIYFIIMGAAAALCGWAVPSIIKEYKYWKNKDEEQKKEEENK